MTAESSVSTLFDQSFLSQLEQLSVISRQLARGRQRAERKAMHRGVSPEFAEYRRYTPGDDTRYIDWNAYVRWRTVVLKLFIEEHDLPIYLGLDCTRSMHWGAPNKFDYARRVAAGLTYVGLSNQDRIGIAPLGSVANTAIPVNRGKGRFWQILDILEGYATAPDAADTAQAEPQSLDELVRAWLSRKPHRGVFIFLTDLWGNDLDDATMALDRLRYARHEVAVIQIIDGSETTAGSLGEFRMREPEAGNVQTLVVDPGIARQYAKLFADYEARVARYCRQFAIPRIRVETQVPEYDLLLRVLREGNMLQ